MHAGARRARYRTVAMTWPPLPPDDKPARGCVEVGALRQGDEKNRPLYRGLFFSSPCRSAPTSTHPRAGLSSGGKGGQVMATVRYRALRAPACIALLALAACARQGEGEMSWARSALERNAAVEVVAADEQSRTFTVRMKDTGELRAVRADQLIAGVAATGSASAK